MSTVDAALQALLAGLPVILPTDTVYGIAVDASRSGATERLFMLKERPVDVPLPVVVADLDQAESLGELSGPAAELARRFWPGGLTLVVPRRPGVHFDLGGRDDGRIGLRVPDHDVPRALAAQVGPLAVTSANRHGRMTPETAEAAAAELRHAIAIVIDGGRCAGAPSTVVSCTATGVQVLREGAIAADDIEAALR